jgi:hypothetical protein
MNHAATKVGPYLAYFSTLKMEATYSSERSFDFQRIIQRVPEDRTLRNHRRESQILHCMQSFNMAIYTGGVYTTIFPKKQIDTTDQHLLLAVDAT